MRSDHLSKHIKTHNGSNTDKKGSTSGSDSENSQSEAHSVNSPVSVGTPPLGPPNGPGPMGPEVTANPNSETICKGRISGDVHSTLYIVYVNLCMCVYTYTCEAFEVSAV
ncbi:hypothetical protein CEXT_539031 [Caerostris extrusa]|uniref:Uncharacterized protein n=1 Tax=Caerostris extrusa TaxID=172846 RepID=A0AAV4RAQ9_CAEEX|nr:hypothetical protein CEXT_539031 [Caerostris extrusa]